MAAGDYRDLKVLMEEHLGGYIEVKFHSDKLLTEEELRKMNMDFLKSTNII